MICHFGYGFYFTKYEFSEIKVRFLNQPTGYHSTGVAYALSLVFYGILGILQYHGGGADMSKVAELSGELANIFNLNPLLLLPPVIVIVYDVRRYHGGYPHGGNDYQQAEAAGKDPDCLVVMTEITAIIANFAMCAQYIAIIVPGRMFSREYQEAGLSPETLSNALESSVSVTSGLIPWNTCGAFMVTTLGMGALEFAPWAVFCWITPVVCAVMAFMGLTVADKDGVLLCKKRKAA